MEYRSVRMTENTYEKLARRKNEDEPFSEVVDRLPSERSITELAKLFSEEEIEEIQSRRGESRVIHCDPSGPVA